MKFGRIIFVLLLGPIIALHSATASRADIWYEDNNMGRGGGMPPDFVEKFRNPESFAQATSHINVYLMRGNVLRQMDDAFFTKLFVPYLEKNKIKLAINTGGATWANANARRREMFDAEISLLRRLKALGAKVDYISLQSILSKPWRGNRGEFPLDRRIAGAVDFVREAKAIYPDASFGIIDALPAKGLPYREPYRQLADALKKAGSELSYIHLDMPFDTAKTGRRGVSWASIREVERYVEDDLGVKFGVFMQSRRAGHTSSAAFHEAVLSMLNCYLAADGTPRDYVLASWFPFPDKTVPDTASGDDYPAMRNVLEFGKRLTQVQSQGPAGVERLRNDSGLAATCGSPLRQ